MPDDPARPPRFPYVGALLCAACVGTAVWLWMMYSYSWDTTPAELRNEMHVDGRWPEGAFVRVRGKIGDVYTNGELVHVTLRLGGRERDIDERYHLLLYWPDVWVSGCTAVCVILADPLPEQSAVWGSEGTFTGRVGCQMITYAGDLPITVAAGASRLTPESIAGLVVGAMGVFVFGVALRHWLGERRKLREEARVWHERPPLPGQ